MGIRAAPRAAAQSPPAGDGAIQFTCKECSEVWDEEPSAGQIIECPVCGHVIKPQAPEHEPATMINPTSAPGMSTTIQQPAGAMQPAPPRAAAPAASGMTHAPTRVEPAAAPLPPQPANFEQTAINAGNPSTIIVGQSDHDLTTPPPRTSAPGSGSGFSAPPPRSAPGASAPAKPSGKSGATGAVTGNKLAAEMQHLIGRNLNGYVVQKILGVGGMGAVFLAHQVSLDREVALKVLPSRFASNPELLARFTREALSAAQMNHHNIVQVYDVGNADDVHYIAMEYVRGSNLADMVKHDGRLTVDDAAGYVLQAARGLKFAHDHGIIHRDIKPGNLMVNEIGVVKIADMGLVKMRGQAERTATVSGAERDAALKRAGGDDLTMADIAMGTPAYMAPEQARDASSVDARADQYSLGCTLYYIVAGKAPFVGQTAHELISRHQRDPLPPLETHVTNVPPAFSAICEKMLAKKPDDRYPTLTEAVHALESFLGVESEKGPYSPREQHLAVLENSLKQYYGARMLKARRLAGAVFAGAVPALFVLAVIMGQLPLAGGIIGLGVFTLLGNFVVNGMRNKEFLFRRVRAVFFGMPARGWAKFVGGTALVLFTLFMLNLLVPWVIFAVLGFGVAALYQVFIVKPLRAERQVPINRMNGMLRELRLRGVGEDALHDFVCRFSGPDWEEFFEELFGYEPMVLARGKWAAADQTQKRRSHATWREPVARWLDGVEEARKTAREKRQLAKVEAKRLEARGVSAPEAQRQAAEEATRIIKQDVVRSFRDKQREAEALQGAIKGTRRRSLSIGLGFMIVRLALAAVLILTYGRAMGVPDVDPTGLVNAVYGAAYPYGVLTVYLGLLAGAGLVLSVFSTRPFAIALVFVGSALFTGGQALITAANNPMLTPLIAFYATAAAIVAGVGLMIWGKIKDGRF